MFRKIGFIILLFALPFGVEAQKIMRNTSILNYQRADKTLLHFGFSLGVNYMDYKASLSGVDSLRTEGGKIDMGFLVGIISELRISDDLGLRFSPALEFATRSLVYTKDIPPSKDPRNTGNTGGDAEDNKVPEDNREFSYNESVYLSLPLMLKYKAKRINNFRPFLIAGGSYKYDLQKHDNIDPDRSVFFRTDRHDFFLEMGGGCDFYLPYFKCGIELRFSLGLTDVLIPELDLENPGYDEYTNALKKIKSRMFTICFNFE